MPKYKVFITKSVFKLLSRIPDETADKLEALMLTLEDNARPSGCKKLKGRNAYRIRLGNYRIIYEIHDNILTVIVINVGHRKEVYQ
jgi:mRNA interferase RelE/StbE